uniref:Helicase ATP-binding domain-containing protein n=1 Tax=Magallana gigas TaxID=29159 RepID=A0A8W8P364_MAGGI
MFNSETRRESESGSVPVILMSPESIFHRESELRQLFSTEIYLSQVAAIAVDEAHCVEQWTIKSRYEKSGRSLKYYGPAIVQVETTTKNIYTFKKTLIESLKPGRHYRLIMDTLFDLTEDEKKMRTNFFSPPTFTMADASSLANCTRLCLGPVQVKSIGETGVVSTRPRLREVQLAMEGRSALLTLWGKETDLEVVTGELYIIQNIVPSNDFNKQRCYSSTPLTTFETYESAELMEHFEGVVQSVSFTSNLIEIQDHMFTISKNNLAKIFPEGKFKCVEVVGMKNSSEICEMTFESLVGRKGDETSFGFAAMHASNGIIEVVQGFPYRHTRPSEEIPGNVDIATECCWEPI